VIEKRSVIFKYKGDRSYIHGTDMFNELIQASANSPLTNIIFTVHDFVRERACEIIIASTKKELNETEAIKTRCQMDVDGKTRWVVLREINSHIDTKNSRYEYDEDKVISICNQSEQMISLGGESPFTFIETIVVMNKYLLEQMFSDADGKWVFTRINLKYFCNAKSGLSLTFKHNMNFRLLKSEIMINGEVVGDLGFTLVKS